MTHRRLALCLLALLATPALARAQDPRVFADASLERGGPMARRLVAVAASHTGGLLGRYLLNDTRADEWDSQIGEKRRRKAARQSATRSAS